MDDAAPQHRDRLPSIKQILAILAAGVLLFPGLCLAIGFSTRENSTAITVMIVLAVASVVLTVGGSLLLLIRAIRDFMRH